MVLDKETPDGWSLIEDNTDASDTLDIDGECVKVAAFRKSGTGVVAVEDDTGDAPYITVRLPDNYISDNNPIDYLYMGKSKQEAIDKMYEYMKEN